MPIYRVHRKLSFGHGKIVRPGVYPSLSIKDEILATLVERGAVSVAFTPPLAELPGWKTRAKRLKTIDIETVEQFVEASETVLSRKLRLKKANVLQLKQELIEEYLTPREDESDCCG